MELPVSKPIIKGENRTTIDRKGPILKLESRVEFTPFSNRLDANGDLLRDLCLCEAQISPISTYTFSTTISCILIRTKSVQEFNNFHISQDFVVRFKNLWLIIRRILKYTLLWFRFLKCAFVPKKYAFLFVFSQMVGA